MIATQQLVVSLFICFARCTIIIIKWENWPLSLQWQYHFNTLFNNTILSMYVVAKSNKVLGFLRRNTPNSLGVTLRRELYLMLVRSILCYGSQTILLLERMQRCATRFILSYQANLSYKDRLVKLNLLPLCYLLEYLDLVRSISSSVALSLIILSIYLCNPMLALIQIYKKN
jgi:hypothetical protein